MAKHWYRIEMGEDGKRGVCGSSQLDLDEMLKQLSTAAYIRLDDMFYRDSQNQFRPWTDWEPRLEPTGLIRCSSIRTVMPFKGTPPVISQGGRSDGPA